MKIIAKLLGYYTQIFAISKISFQAKKFRCENISGEALNLIGGTRIAIDDDGKVCYLMGGSAHLKEFKCDEEFECELKFEFPGEVATERHSLSIPITPGSKIIHGNTVSLAHPAGGNIYHFLVEACYDLIKAKLNGIRVDNMVVNTDMPKRFLTLIRKIEPSAKIFKVKKNELIRINALFAYPLEKSFQLHWGRSGRPKPCHYFDKDVLKYFRKILNELYSDSFIKYPRKYNIIFFIRKSKHRNTINEKMVHKSLERPFLCRPEKISFYKLIKLFEGADYLIAQSSAALANLIFIKNKIKVISWQYIGPEQNDSLFKDFVETLGHEFYLLNAVPIFNHDAKDIDQESDITQSPLIFTNFDEIKRLTSIQKTSITNE